MGYHRENFEFHAKLTGLDEALQTLHHSVVLMRDAAHRPLDERALMLFETALGEIGANVLTHGRPGGHHEDVAYLLRFDGDRASASFSDRGPEVNDHLSREMPDPLSESGRGLAMARALLDELGYVREGDLNTWRLVKRL
jgi:serine/threonine-protein kinase RsbW